MYYQVNSIRLTVGRRHGNSSGAANVKLWYVLLGSFLLAGVSMAIYELPKLRRVAKVRAMRQAVSATC